MTDNADNQDKHKPSTVQICVACRQTGMYHCSSPDECGEMKTMAYADAEVLYKNNWRRE